MMSKLVTFGEIMMRLQTKPGRRFRQSIPGDMEVIFGGAEANVAASFVLLGGAAAFVTALPENPIADACIGSLRAIGVDVSNMVRSKEGRLGIYFVEAGANQRPSNVVYDRDYSSVSMENASSYKWGRIFRGADWFHTTGITPALSKIAAQAALNALKKAKKAGLTVSCDLNFRKKLWRWKNGISPSELASRVMSGLLPFVDVLIANEEDVGDVLGIKDKALDTADGSIDVNRYPDIAGQVAKKFPNIKKIAFTLRESISATHNRWGCMLYDTASGAVHFAPQSNGSYSPYPITDIVDRIGGGDSFGAALIYALLDDELKQDDGKAAAFAAAASCLCHTIYGDFNYSTKDEVLTLMRGSTSGRIVR
ncbi:MAG: sugar kinase [Spirochaetaceae bacterium]|jgi:2-dehydro-3-deoxygluconokinase|nr:sugar kinase [Spirochaetaceae bacterium]